MSRSSERRVVGVGLAVLIAGSGLLLPSSADAAPGAPVLPIKAPVLDIQFNESDLKRQERVESRPKQTKITLDSTVLFGKDSAKINSSAQGRLASVGTRLKSRGPGKVTITGYTDDLGTAAHGKDLSRRRAAAVSKVLRGQLPTAQYPFTLVGKGEDDPAVPNTSEKNRRINRRVVVLYQAR